MNKIILLTLKSRLTDGTYGIKLAEDGFDFNTFNNDRFNSYDVAFYNGAQVRYDISEVYLKLDAGRPDLKSDGSYQVLTTDAYATAAVADKIGYKKLLKLTTYFLLSRAARVPIICLTLRQFASTTRYGW